MKSDLSHLPEFEPNMTDEEFCNAYESIINISYSQLDLVTKAEFHKITALKNHPNPNVLGRLRSIYAKCKYLVNSLLDLVH